MTTTCGSSATKTRRRSPDYADSCSEDSCLAKNLLRSVTSDDDDDGAATGRLRPPTVRDLRPSGWPCSACASTMSAWKISGMLAVPTRDCPFCWASVPVVDDCENCTNLSSYRCSTPGIRITPSTESPTSSTAACVHGDHQDNVHTSVAKRRCSSLTNDVDTAAPAAACRSVPDIARNSLCGHMTATPQPASSTKDRWLSAGVASLPRPTTLPRADTLTTCLHSPSN